MSELKLGNIFYDEEIVSIDIDDYPLINFIEINDDYSNIVSKKLPSLFVGYENLKRINKSKNLFKNISILKKQIIKNLCYWEFTYSENKQDHVNGVNYFIYNTPYYYFSRYNYSYIDPIFENISDVTQLFKRFIVDSHKVYELDDMIYVLTNRNIYGISKKQYRFFDFDINNIITMLKNTAKEYISDQNREIYLEKSKLISNFDILDRYIVTII